MTELPDRRMVRLSGLCERTYNERHHIKYYYKCTDSFVPAIWFSCDPVCDGTVFYLFAYHNETGGRGIRGAFSVWWQYFRGNVFFRKLFFLTFYTTMILFRTLLNRDMWMNPLSDVMATGGSGNMERMVPDISQLSVLRI